MMNVLLELVTKDGAYKINSLNFTLKLLTIAVIITIMAY